MIPVGTTRNPIATAGNSMSKFNDGDMVIVKGVATPLKVRTARRDGDGEIKVYNRDETDWHYVKESDCQLVPSAQHASIGAAYASSQPTNSNQEGTAIMANTTRSIVKVVLIDQDAGLEPSKALVKDFGEHVLEGSQEDLKMQIVMSNNMESLLRAHNEMRGKEIDLDIRQRTGNEVKLAPRKLHELTWKIGVIA
ncbi:hypothetical protein CHOED_066 [Vibrio phage CHOED]|uniref:hypothetical protein n=1 Tax=Vibrio phage CHOED TaxID=1458716 RepID=UPI00042F3031|nr:hypothetical protein CHOED_066 [Vibrio phage CHOED]AHK11926.1 hypothetical protein CHOED_066 [Vibrio phage CHOED]